MNRRNFFKVVAGTGALVAASPFITNQKLFADDGTLYQAYEKVQLVDASGAPIKASSLKKEVNYIFNYPHVGTPCMLIDLPEAAERNVKLKSEDGQEYVWKGGIGKDKSIVAFSAICSHQLAHPTPEDSFIKYVPTSGKTMSYKSGGVIVCSSHLSAFDAASGSAPLSGPAAQPLASVLIEIADDDTIWASGILGPDKFHEYFSAYKPEMKKYYGNHRKAKKLVKVSAKTVTLQEYSDLIIQY